MCAIGFWISGLGGFQGVLVEGLALDRKTGNKGTRDRGNRRNADRGSEGAGIARLGGVYGSRSMHVGFEMRFGLFAKIGNSA